MLSQELYDWLVLWYAPKINTRIFHQLLQQFKSPGNFLKEAQVWENLNLPAETLYYLTRTVRDVDTLIKKDLDWQTQPQCHIITFHHPNYPTLLKEVHDPPPVLFVKGDPHQLHAPQIAMVGSRKPSITGLEIAQEFSQALILSGLTVTSGLALGIDAAAHRGALSQGGRTVAVLGSGVDRIYPPQNQKLGEEIIEKGALISEFHRHMPPKKENFPQRNRTVSGLTLGTLVIEASLRSGSLITARYAVEQGREVFAVPGSVRNLQAQGCHFLIQQGAKLTSNVADVLEELKGFDYGAHKNKYPDKRVKQSALLSHEKNILACLGYEPTPIDLIKARSGLDVSQVSQTLCDLTLKKEVAFFLHGYIKIK